MTLPQEYFDLVERAAVSKPPHRVFNPRLVDGPGDLFHLLSLSDVVGNGVSTMTSSLERPITCNLYLPPPILPFQGGLYWITRGHIPGPCKYSAQTDLVRIQLKPMSLGQERAVGVLAKFLGRHEVITHTKSATTHLIVCMYVRIAAAVVNSCTGYGLIFLFSF